MSIRVRSLHTRPFFFVPKFGHILLLFTALFCTVILKERKGEIDGERSDNGLVDGEKKGKERE